MTTTHLAGTARRNDYPAAGARFHWLAALLGLWTIIGLFVDGYAHNHGAVDNTFFTPWHALLYSGVTATGVLLLATQYRHVLRGHRFDRALPRGYLPALLGVILFLLGGGFDMLWHEAFGFEANLEALLSPAHLLLAFSAVLFLSGPLRAAERGPVGWPVVLALTLLLSLFTFFGQFAHMLSSPEVLIGRRPGGSTYLADVTGIANVIIPAALMTGVLLYALRRWRLPVGAVTLMLMLNGVGMFWLRAGHHPDWWPLLLAPLAAGIVGDALLWRGADRRILAFAVPLIYALVFFAVGAALGQIWWTIHLWLGASVLAGAVGLGLALLATGEGDHAAG